MEKRFENKVILITGGGGYIGGVTARRFAKEGAKLVLCDKNEQALQKVKEKILEENGIKEKEYVLAVPTDVTDSASVEQAFSACLAQFGRLDVMVHVAGGSARIAGGAYVSLDEQSDEVIDTVLKVNLYGAFYASRAAARIFKKQNQGGRIINFSSTVGICGLKTCVDYAAAKGGIISLTKALAKELGEYHVTVNSVAPGIVQRPGDTNEAIKTNFLGQKCEADDVANVVLFLCSEEGRFVTGQTYVIDGGRSLAMKGTD